MKNDDDIIPVSIFDVYPYPDAQQGAGAPQSFLVLLKGNADERVVPITIGHFEGQALAMAMRKIAMPRPLPHDLLRCHQHELLIIDEKNCWICSLVIPAACICMICICCCYGDRNYGWT